MPPRGCWFVVYFLTAASLAAPIPAQAEPAAAAPRAIAKTSAPITIDGRLDEPAWRDAVVTPVHFVHGKIGEVNPQSPLNVRFAYDDHYLYIGYETFDANLVAQGSGKTEGPAERPRAGAAIWDQVEKVDVVEFFISFGDRHFFWELHHNAANQFNDVWINVLDPAWPIAQSALAPYGLLILDAVSLQDDEVTPATVASAVAVKSNAAGKPSTINDASDTDAGYTAELRLPWQALGPPRACQTFLEKPHPDDAAKTQRVPGPWKMAGQEMLILAVAQDGDLKSRYHHSSPTAPGDWFHKMTAHWPRYVCE